MKVIVTGAAGFIGSHTAERLHELGHEVIGIDNFSSYYDVSLKKLNAKTLSEKNIPVLKVDIRTGHLEDFIPSDIDFIFHFSAQPGISSDSTFEDYFSNNVLGTQRLLDLIEKRTKKPFFVNIATSSIYGFLVWCYQIGSRAISVGLLAKKPIAKYFITFIFCVWTERTSR